MKKTVTFLLVIFIFTSLQVLSQEPTVKILVMTERSNKDEIILKNGTHLKKRITFLKEDAFVMVGRKSYQWNEISTIRLSQLSLKNKNFSPNWGDPIPVHYDSTQLNDRVVLKDGSVSIGTIFDYTQFYRVRIENGFFNYRTAYWNDIKEVYLGKGSPFMEFSTDLGMKKVTSTNIPTGKADNTLKTTDSRLKLGDNQFKLNYTQELNSDQIRKAWQIRGGPIFCNEYNLSLSMLSAQGMTGTGFGYSVATSLINLKPPSYSDGISNTSALKLGVNCNFQLLFLKMNTGGVSAKGSMNNINLGLNLGYQMGFGKFLGYKDWKGVMFGFAWRPQFQLTSSSITVNGSTYASTDSNFNAKGYEFYFDFANLQAITSRFVKPAHMKVFAIILPPVGAAKMTFVQIGFGMVSY